MGSRIYLSADVSDVSGYRMGYVDMRKPDNAGTASTFVTNTTGSGDDIEVTATAGGTATNWITKPFRSDTVIDSEVYVNVWGHESNASANAGLGLRLAEYTTSEQSAIQDHDFGTEFSTSTAVQNWLTDAVDTTTIDAGNRLVIDLRIVAVGTMGGSQTATVTFDTDDDDENGDSFIMFGEQIRVNEAQMGSGSTSMIRGKSVGAFQETIDRLNEFLGVIAAENQTVQCLIDDLEKIRDNQ